MRKTIHNIKDFLTDSLYYPACGVDWEVIKYCNEHYDQLGINKFIYADYWIGETMLKNNLESFSEYPLGYNLIESHSVSPSALGFDLSLNPECSEFDKVVKKGNSLPKYFFSGGARGTINIDYIWNGYRPILDFPHKQDESVTLWQQL